MPEESQQTQPLRDDGVLNTASGPAFDHITSLATRLFQVPVAAVMLIEGDRQWFASARGLAAPEIPPDASFLALTSGQDDVFTVADTHLDPRFARRPLIRGERGWRFYAGAPLRTAEGHILGALFVADYQPRDFGEAERQSLRELAALARDELLLHRLRQALAAAPEMPAPRSETEAAPDFLAAARNSQQIVDQASDAIFVYNFDARFVDVNQAASALTGYSRKELLALGVADIERDFDLGHAQARWREMAVGEAVTMEGTGRRKDGSIFLAEASISVVEIHHDRFLLGLVRDISVRKRAEALLQRRARQQQAIAKLGNDALCGKDLAALFDASVQVVGEVFQAEVCVVLEHIPSRSEFLVHAGVNAPRGNECPGTFPDAPEYPAGFVLQTEEPVIIEDFASEKRFRCPPWLHKQKIVGGMLVPVGGDGSGSPVYGVMAVYATRSREFTADDIYFVRSAANVLAAAVARRRGEDALRAVEARYQQIATNTSGMVFNLVMKPDFTFSAPFISAGCRQIYELEPHEIQANPHVINRVVHPDEGESYRERVRRSARTLEPFLWEGRVLLPSGTLRWVGSRARLDRQDNGDVVWNGVVFDMTELKQAQETALHAKEEAERANEAKSRFLSRMSHELRTPLNAILGFGQVLELGQFDETESQCIRHILKGGRHLLSLIDEVLDLARVEAGELALHSAAISLEKLVLECTGFVAKMAQARGIVCTPKLGPASRLPVWADEQRLRQVLLNLLSNAIKYNREGGRVTVTCQRTPAGRLRCRIADTGPGLSPADLARLFVPFERLGQEFGETEGSGLGLVISRRLAEAMGGAVGAESDPGAGSTFWVEIPLAPATTETPPGQGSVAPAPGSGPADAVEATVLYVEDNFSNLQVVTTIAQRLRPRWRVLTAPDGPRGLQLAREQHPDVVLLDLHLPRLNGDAVLTALRADPALARTPVLLLSADATARSRERLLQLGADDYVSKPFNVPDLLAKIDGLLAG